MKNIRIIITKIIHVATIITNTLKKVLFNLVMTKIHNRSIIFAAVGLRLTWVQFYCHDFDQNRPPQMISPGFPTLS